MKRSILVTAPRLNVLHEYRRWIYTALILLFMLIASVSLATGQSGNFSGQIGDAAQRPVTSLRGTAWTWILPVDYGTGTLHCFYRFEDGQKVIRRVVAIAGDRLQLGIDNNMLLFYGTHRLTINHLPPAISIKERVGKYTQTGNTLALEFSDSAVVQVLTYDKAKGLWFDKNDRTFPKLSKVSPAVNPTPLASALPGDFSDDIRRMANARRIELPKKGKVIMHLSHDSSGTTGEVKELDLSKVDGILVENEKGETVLILSPPRVPRRN